MVLRGLGIGDITLWHGELHVRLASAAAGQTLFDFDTSQFAAALKGFPVDGKIDVILEHDAVRIPISLKLPPYLGGVTGQATLLANNRDGLVLDSLQIGVSDVILGALEIKDLNVSYTRDGDIWTGGAKFNIPPHTGEFAIDVQVRFDGGELTMGSFGFGFFPGIPVFTDLYLNHFGGGFDLHTPKRIFGDVSVGAIPLDPPTTRSTSTGRSRSPSAPTAVRRSSRSAAPGRSTARTSPTPSHLPDQRILRGRRQRRHQPRRGRGRGRDQGVRRPPRQAVLGRCARERQLRRDPARLGRVADRDNRAGRLRRTARTAVAHAVRRVLLGVGDERRRRPLQRREL